ncbi:MAG: GNAT family N-acetyltransferase, partial [Candidatus Cloacimonetes bacterium]|nr:GNAT family N-acetyltransferase [Candidatus Cloacimonadota bacterium]
KVLDEDKLMTVLIEEGEDWSCYWTTEARTKYQQALEQSITYVCYDEEVLCGFSRSLDDCGFYVYVCDLLVKPAYRGKNLGRKLMECIAKDYHEQTVYVMSDVDEYYRKQGYRREGSVFEVSPDALYSNDILSLEEITK